MIFSRRPLDAITQEVVISLSDEPERWRARPLPHIPYVLQICLVRDDGLVVSARESLTAPWRVRALAIFSGDERYTARGRELCALLKALDGWMVCAEAHVAEPA